MINQLIKELTPRVLSCEINWIDHRSDNLLIVLLGKGLEEKQAKHARGDRLASIGDLRVNKMIGL